MPPNLPPGTVGCLPCRSWYYSSRYLIVTAVVPTSPTMRFVDFNGCHRLPVPVDSVFEPLGCLFFKPLICSSPTTCWLWPLHTSPGAVGCENTRPLSSARSPHVFSLLCWPSCIRFLYLLYVLCNSTCSRLSEFPSASPSV